MQANIPLTVSVHARGVPLIGDLMIPSDASGVVVFAHGSGSSRTSPRNRRVAEVLNGAGFATLLFDLLTPAEEVAERYTRHLRFDIRLLATRMVGAIEWVQRHDELGALPIGLFGASTGAAAALIAATRTRGVSAIVSRGGRPDLAGDALAAVDQPTLLIVGSRDPDVLALNQAALARLNFSSTLHVVRGATHLFEEHGALEEVTEVATLWFRKHLAPVERDTGLHVH
jgi:pimeloyl-ACP methyl ester carboxylesterase